MKILPQKELSQRVIALAYPVVLGMIARTTMNIVDAAMVGRLGAASLAATALGAHIVLVATYSFGTINVGVQAITSRRFGENKFILCGRTLNKSLLILALIGLIASFVGFTYGRSMLSLIADDPEVYNLGEFYVTIRFLEILPFLLIGVYRGFFDGIGITKVNMQSMIIMNLLNVVLNYLLIYGKFGFPRLEVSGAGIASMISSYLGLTVMIAHSSLPKYRKKYELYKRIIPDFNLIGRLTKLSAPVMIQTFLVFSGFLAFLKIFSMMGTIELAATNVCIAIMSLSFMPAVGMGVAAATLVGQSLGAKRADLAEKYGWESVKLGSMLMGSFGIVFLSIPGLIMKIFTVDPLIIREGVIALRIVGMVQFIDAFGIILMHCLQSAGMTRYVMITEISINWGIFLPLAYILGIVLDMGTFGAWLSLAVYILIFGIIMTLTFIKGNWKTHNV